MADLSLPLPASRPAAFAPLIAPLVGAAMAALLGMIEPSVTLDCGPDPSRVARCVGREQTWLGASEPVAFDLAETTVELEQRRGNRYLALRTPRGPVPFARELRGADAARFHGALSAAASGGGAELHLSGGFSLRPFFLLVPALAALLLLPAMFQRGGADVERRAGGLWVRRRRALGGASEALLPLAPGEEPRLEVTPLGRRGHGMGQLWGESSGGRLLLIDMAPSATLLSLREQIGALYRRPEAA